LIIAPDQIRAALGASLRFFISAYHATIMDERNQGSFPVVCGLISDLVRKRKLPMTDRPLSTSMTDPLSEILTELPVIFTQIQK